MIRRENKMKLIMKRDQRDEKGVFGGDKGVTFILTCRVELDPMEQELVSKYKTYDQVLIHKGSEQISELTITKLINGVTEEFSDMGTMIKNEEVIKKACESFKNRLLVMATFGEQVIEY
jgi:predicted GIY-YIG superfamily endonuclease